MLMYLPAVSSKIGTAGFSGVSFRFMFVVSSDVPVLRCQVDAYILKTLRHQHLCVTRSI